MLNSFSRAPKAHAKIVVLLMLALLTFGVLSSSVMAEIRVLATGGDLSGPQATEEVFANGALAGTIDRPGWTVYRELTTEDIVNNYDVLIIPFNTADWQFDFDWNTRVLPFLASGGGVIWEAPMTTGYAGTTLFEQRGDRYVCPDGTICFIPDSPLNVLAAPGLSDGITSDFTFTTGYFSSWDPRLTPFLQVNALGLGTLTYGLYGQINAGRIVLTQNAQDNGGLSTGTPAQVNAYNLLINKLQWVSSSTQAPDPNLRFVPKLGGMTEAQAVAAVQGLGFVVDNIYYTISNTDISGNVVSQNPQPGAGGFVGGAITLIVESPPTGPATIVPNITYMASADAEATLAAAGLNRGSTVWSSHPSVPAGSIISHNPVAGQSSYQGWSIDVAESTGPNPGSVPYVIHHTQADAVTALNTAGYVLGNVSYQSHNVVPAGYVVSQNPWGDSPLAAGSAVDLVLSSATADPVFIAVPDVVGQSQANAVAAISNAGLNAAVSTANSDTVAAGIVISQTPGSGAEALAGSYVQLVVSAGPAPQTAFVPSVAGLTQSAAESAIVNAGLVVGAVTSTNSNTVPAGNVISQTPAGGTEVNLGTQVDLVISSGPALVVVPNVVGRTYANARTTITSAGLTVGTVSTVLTANSCGIVRSQNPGGGSNVQAGTAVNLVVTRTRRCNPL